MSITEKISNGYKEGIVKLYAAAQGKAGAIADAAIKTAQVGVDAYGMLSDADTTAIGSALNTLS